MESTKVDEQQAWRADGRSFVSAIAREPRLHGLAATIMQSAFTVIHYRHANQDHPHHRAGAAGSALRGYGNLIIIKHNDDYLSAYAHNDQLLVKETQKVKAGQVIARMGDTDSDRVNLHFEIRYRGEAVNPALYLPKK